MFLFVTHRGAQIDQFQVHTCVLMCVCVCVCVCECVCACVCSMIDIYRKTIRCTDQMYGNFLMNCWVFDSKQKLGNAFIVEVRIGGAGSCDWCINESDWSEDGVGMIEVFISFLPNQANYMEFCAVSDEENVKFLSELIWLI